MALDLSALDEPTEKATQVTVATGEPLRILLVDIDEDPDQPRTEFSDEAMQEMVLSVKARGVKTPVSVRPNPAKEGRWILNFGARRFRASRAAGLADIPAFVDRMHTDYDQVMENIEREDLSPMELALFIKRKLDGGDSASVVAKKLNKDKAVITRHLALIDAPACIDDAYTLGKSHSAVTLYALRNLHERYPDEVEAWCVLQEEITRGGVAALGRRLTNSGPDTAADGELGGKTGEVAAGGVVAHAQQDLGGKTDPQVLVSHNPKNDSKETKEGKPDDPSKIKKPVLLVEYKKRAARILLHKRPSEAGLIHIKHEDDGSEIEVDAKSCKLSLLVESTV